MSPNVRTSGARSVRSDKKLIALRQTDMRMIALLSFTTLLGKTAGALARSGINRHVT